MGITGLLPFVKKSCRPANLKDFVGATVAIDAYSWLHKGAFSCAEKLVKGEKTDGYVFYCMKLLNLLLDAGLKPIMVYDGMNLSSKAVTEKKRRENREKTRQQGKELLCNGNIKEARECFQRCVDVTPEMARDVIVACKKKSIDCIVAPYEADAQLAYLSQIGVAQIIITEDSDLILFGCNRILFKMDGWGGGLLYEKENLPKSLGANASKFSFEKFRYMCILSGCDYLQSLPGIGLAKAFKFFKLTTNTELLSVLPKVPSYLKMPNLVVSEEYKESFIKANNTFLYQLVFCPHKKGLVPLNPYPENIDPSDMEYAGNIIPDNIAYQIAIGNINFRTMREFDSQDDNFTLTTPTTRKSVLWDKGSGPQAKKESIKVDRTAFTFSSHKRKSMECVKRKFVQVERKNESTMFTDEEMISMYGNLNPAESMDFDCFEEDPLFPLDREDKEKNVSFSSVHQKTLSLPVQKIAKSRFFASPTNKARIAPNSPVTDIYPQKDNISPIRDMTNIMTSESDELIDPVEVHNKVTEKSPINDSTTKKINLNPFKLKRNNLENSKWLDIIEDEYNAETTTLSSTGEATKLLTANIEISPKSPKKTVKRLKTTRIHDFKWNKTSPYQPKLNNSQSSSCSSGYESSSQDINSSLDTSISPYFTPNSSICGKNLQKQESVDDVTDDIVILKDNSKKNVKVFSSCPSPVTALASLSIKHIQSSSKSSKLGRCHSLGLSRTRKLCDKVSRKETLLDFNFVRQPKKEAVTIS